MSNTEEPGASGVSDGSDFFDPTLATDAGEGPEMVAAAAEAKKVTINMAHRKKKSEGDQAEAYLESNLVARAKALVRLDSIKFIHFKMPRVNDPMDIGMKAKPDSLMNRHAVYDALFDNGSGVVPFPYYDTFRGRLVDHQGNPFSAKTLRTRELVQALDAAGMESPTDKEIADSLRSWALDHERDSLDLFFQASMPVWDKKPRMDTLLIDLFQPFDTKLNRQVGRYFWLSLYNRITNPGSLAPISIALIGGQDAGKSYFSVLLCRLLTGDFTTGPVTLDLAKKEYNSFLRNITGRSLIANVGEMAGFRKGDMLRIKEFVTKTEDDLDFKYEDSIIKRRQWIIIMDGNEYAGMQRDDTGNRRFYPMFVFQEKDVNGQPMWATGMKVDFEGFKDKLWQVMAECRDWMSEHGEDGYTALVGDTNAKVSEFSTGEMNNARGLVKDDNIESSLKNVLFCCPYRRVAQGSKESGFFVSSHDISHEFMRLTRKEPFSRSLAPHMKALGFIQKQISVRGYFMPDEGLQAEDGSVSEMDMKVHIWKHNAGDVEMDDDQIRSIIGEMSSKDKDSGF